MKVVLCDDDIQFVKRIKKEINAICVRQNLRCKVTTYCDPQRMLQREKAEKDKVFFLDIEMPDITGFHVAERLREQCEDVVLVFISSKEDLVFTSFNYHPYFFLRKSRIMEELPEKFPTLWQSVAPKEVGVALSGDEGQITDLGKVSYGEMRQNYLYLHTEDGCLRIRKPIAQAEKEWSGYGFIRTHKSYIVNPQYIASYTMENVTMRDGTLVPVGRPRQKTVYEQVANAMFSGFR